LSLSAIYIFATFIDTKLGPMLACYSNRLIYMFTFMIGFVATNISTIQANDDFETRKAAFIEKVNQYASSTDVVVQAYTGSPVNQQALAQLLLEAQTSAEADFRLTRIIRVLYFSDGQYDNQILPAIQDIPYWLPDPDNLRQYWSENHMIMWMTSEWLLGEKYGWETRPTLRENLVHWLELKIEYGYYEFLSPTYWPFTSAALLNLIDFAEDDEIQSLANEALTKLYKDALLFVNDKGVFYPTAGRTSAFRYFSPYGSSMQSVIYLLTGLGQAPTSGSIGASNLATSTYDATEAIESWSSKENLTFHAGHPLSESPQIHGHLDLQDRIIFDWSAGGYFHPEVAQNTLWQLRNYDMSGHEEFEILEGVIDFIPITLGPVVATFAGSISRSSYIGNVEIEIYKDKGVVLSSAQDFWKGRLGYQQWPWVAAIEETAVYTRCGEVTAWTNIPERQSNTSLPYIKQDDNVALVMYRHNWDLPIFGIDNFNVNLYFETDYFDEVKEIGNWQLGRKADSYIAVRRHCMQVQNGIQLCDVSDGQTWAVVVGNSDTHGNFSAFSDVVEAAQYEQRWYFDWQNFGWVYYGSIQVDGKSINHAWQGNVLSGPTESRREGDENGRKLMEEDAAIQVYPNPATDYFMLDISKYEQKMVSFSVYDANGKLVYQENEQSDNQLYSVPTGSWPSGVYSIIVEGQEDINVKRLIVNH
jgi:hypothetical protein